MRENHLQGCLAAATRDKDPYTGHWDWVINLVQTAIQDGILSSECTWQTVVLPTKGDRDF